MLLVIGNILCKPPPDFETNEEADWRKALQECEDFFCQVSRQNCNEDLPGEVVAVPILSHIPAASLAVIHESTQACELLVLVSAFIASLLKLWHPQGFIEDMQRPLAKLEAICNQAVGF